MEKLELTTCSNHIKKPGDWTFLHVLGILKTEK